MNGIAETTTSTAIDRFLAAATRCRQAPAPQWTGPLRGGVDLGTATVVLAVVDAAGEPVYLDSTPAKVVRDGVVVDFQGAVEVVLELRATAERLLGMAIGEAGTAYPPGVGPAESRACRYVLEAAGLDCTALVDEVDAANKLLHIDEGVVVDVGGGSTGVGLVRQGSIATVGDLPGGGHHLDLILAGGLGIPVEEAERLKCARGGDYLHLLRPGVERVAANVSRLCEGQPPLPVHVVGGALMIPGAGEILANCLQRRVIEYRHAALVTPFGIALAAP